MGQAFFVAKITGDVTEYRSCRTGHRYVVSNDNGEVTVKGDTFALMVVPNRTEALTLIELADKHTG